MIAANTPYDAVSEVTQRLGLPEHFVIFLLREDDWSYVVKAHALAEAAITHAIVRHIGNKNVEDFVEDLRMRQRLMLAEGLSLISPECALGLRQLSRLRNLLAHDVSQVGFKFESYLKDENHRNAFFGTYLEGVTGTIDITGTPIDKKKFFRENPKWAVNEFLFNLMLDVYLVETKAYVRESSAKLTEQMFQAIGERANRASAPPEVSNTVRP